jgi:hypothetical protein
MYGKELKEAKIFLDGNFKKKDILYHVRGLYPFNGPDL